MQPPSKKQTLLNYLSRGIAMVHLDARRPGVKVPAQHLGDPHLTLNLSYRYGIHDLIVDDTHVQATLSFRGQPFQCLVPWSAVFCVTSHVAGDAQVWPEDLPVEVRSSLGPEGDERPPDDAETVAQRPRRAKVTGEASPLAAPKGLEAVQRPTAVQRGRQRPSLVAVESAVEPRPVETRAQDSHSSEPAEQDGERHKQGDQDKRGEQDQRGDQDKREGEARPAAGRSHLRLVR